MLLKIVRDINSVEVVPKNPPCGDLANVRKPLKVNNANCIWDQQVNCFLFSS